eukprot:scaffold103895_cov29-Tisochrysis_lutea.AAC.3
MSKTGVLPTNRLNSAVRAWKPMRSAPLKHLESGDARCRQPTHASRAGGAGHFGGWRSAHIASDASESPRAGGSSLAGLSVRAFLSWWLPSLAFASSRV